MGWLWLAREVIVLTCDRPVLKNYWQWKLIINNSCSGFLYRNWKLWIIHFTSLANTNGIYNDKWRENTTLRYQNGHIIFAIVRDLRKFYSIRKCQLSWWINQTERFSTLLDLCAGTSPGTGEFPSKRLVTWSFDIFFDLPLNKRLSKESRRRRFETPPRSLWHHCNEWLSNTAINPHRGRFVVSGLITHWKYNGSFCLDYLIR